MFDVAANAAVNNKRACERGTVYRYRLSDRSRNIGGNRVLI